MGRMTVSASGYGALVSDTAVPTIVPASVTSVTILAANDSRLHGMVFNDSTAVLYLLWGPGPASSTNYSVKMAPNDFYELPRVNPFVGPLTGVWSSATGSAHVTEGT